MQPTTSERAGGLEGMGKGSTWRRLAIPASPTEAVETTDAAREGAREGTAVGTSSEPPITIGSVGRVKTGSALEGRLDDGEGARDQPGAGGTCGVTVSEIRIVLSAKASISSVEDCVGRTGAEVGTKGSGEGCCDRADAREPGPED